MKENDPNAHAGVPVELPSGELDVPLALRLSHAISDLLRGTLIDTPKRNDIKVFASSLQGAAFRAGRTAERREEARTRRHGTWAQGGCVWLNDTYNAAADYRALAARGDIGVHTDLTDRERHAAALDEMSTLRRQRDALTQALEEIKELSLQVEDAGEERGRHALGSEIPFLVDDALAALDSRDERPGWSELPF